MNRLVLITLLVTPLLSQAQLTQRNLLGKRYPPETVRTLLTPRDKWQPYPKTPEAWRQALPDTVRASLVRKGEQAIDKPFEPIPATLTLEYVRNGNRSRYEKVSFGKRIQLLNLVLAESMEGKGRFTDAILNGVWSICEESFWGVPAHLSGQKTGSGLPNVADRTVDLFTAETASLLAITDYLVGEQLAKVSPLVRPRIYLETAQRFFTPITEQPERYGYLKPDTKVNNWNPWIMSNLLTAALLLEPDENRRSQLTTFAVNGADLYINGLGADGGCDEGPGYWMAAGACVFDLLESLHSASNGQIDVFREPIIRNMASYIYKMHIADKYFVDFADADPTVNLDGLMLYRFGKRIQDDTLARFGQWAYEKYGKYQEMLGFFRQRTLQDLLTSRTIGQSATPFQDVRDAWFQDVQVMTARSPKGLYVATHGGHNAESHNHNDVGDFIIYANGKPVIIDVGRGTYTARTFSADRYKLWFNRSEYHNLPIINGVGQREGRPFEAQQVRYITDRNDAQLIMDIAKAYPADAGVRNWQRTVRLNRPTETVTVTDVYSLNTPTSLAQSFMTTCDLNLATPGRITFAVPNEKSVQLVYDPALWAATVEAMPLDTPDDEGLKTKWPNQTIRRITLTNKKQAATGKTTFTFRQL